MKKYIAFLIVPMLVLILSSCEKEETAVDIGNPTVHYVRSTDPAKADSLLVGAFMGSLIAIVGEDLDYTRELWFNNQQATLNPAYITNETILVNVPSTVPSDVTDQIRFVFADGSEMLYDFTVNVPSPVITGIKSEYVPDGGTVVLHGDFFFEPTVTFPDGLEAEIVSVDKTMLEVIVPDGASPGPIEISTNFGKSRSPFLFRDDRNTLLDFDNLLHETWTTPIVQPGEDPEVSACDGAFIVFEHDADGAWLWTNELTMQYWAPRGRGNEPLANGAVSELAFRFEVNVVEWHDIRMEIFLGPYAEDHGRDAPATAIARWKPWMDGRYMTDGWETVTIPLTEFKYWKDDPTDQVEGTRAIENLSSLTNITMMIFGPNETTDGTNPVKVAVDNIRIVPYSQTQ